MSTPMKVLQCRPLIYIALAEFISGVGNWLTMLAILAIVVFRGGGSVVESSGIFLAGLLPTLLTSPLAGWLVDRVDRKLLMIAGQWLSGLTMIGLLFTRSLPLIYTLVAVESVFLTVMTPARQAVVPEIVPRDDLARANAFFQQLVGLTKIGGPVLAGSLLLVISPESAIMLDIISFIAAGAILCLLPSMPPSRVSSPIPAQAPRPGRFELLGVLRDSRQLQLLFLLTFLGIFVIIGFDALSPVYTRDVLGGKENLFGLLVGLIGLGTLGASAAILFVKGKADPWRGLLLGAILVTAIPAFLGVAAMIRVEIVARVLTAAGCLLGGAGCGLLAIQSGTMLQLLSPPSCLGRLGGLFQSTTAAAQLSGIVVAPLLVPAVLPMAMYFRLSTAMMAVLVLSAVLPPYIRRGLTSLRARRSRSVD